MNLFHQKLKSFKQGGLHLDYLKLTATSAIQELPLPSEISIPISQHIGAPAAAIVKPGDQVLTGQLIAQTQGRISANIHASATGTVIRIDNVLDQNGFPVPAIIIKTDPDQWVEGLDTSSTLIPETNLLPQEIIKLIADAGIVGMGGAAFPSHAKLQIPPDKKIDCLIINGSECEPFLTADHRLMLEHPSEIIIGVRILMRALGVTKAFIGIENNKPDAVAILRQAAQSFPEIKIEPLAIRYPQGGERQIIKALLNREIPPPPAGLPMDAGCVVFNVATTFAVYEALQKHRPLFRRVVTVAGKNVRAPGNFWVRIGTPISALIEAAGGLPASTGKIISGGPMMGKALVNTTVPLTKGMSGIVLFPEAESSRKEILPCIRCAKCVTACPLGLEPYLLMLLVQKGMIDRAQEERVLNCCECSCCTYVCPANRPLLDYLRLGKLDVMKRLRAKVK